MRPSPDHRRRWGARAARPPATTFETWTAGVVPTRLWLGLRPGALAALVAALALVATLLPATSGQAAGGSSEVVFPPAGHVFAAEDIPEFTVRATDPEGEPYVARFVARGAGGALHSFTAPPAASGETATGRPNEQILPDDYTWTVTFTTPTEGNPADVGGTFSVLEGIVSDDCDTGTLLFDGVVYPGYAKVHTIQPSSDRLDVCLALETNQNDSLAYPQETLGERFSVLSSDGTPLVVTPQPGRCSAGTTLLNAEAGDPADPLGHLVLHASTDVGSTTTVCLRVGNPQVPQLLVEQALSITTQSGTGSLYAIPMEDTVTPALRRYDDPPEDPLLPSSKCRLSIRGDIQDPADRGASASPWPVFWDVRTSAGRLLLETASWGQDVITGAGHLLEFCARVEPTGGAAVGGYLAFVSRDETLDSYEDPPLHSTDSPCPRTVLHVTDPIFLDVHRSDVGAEQSGVCWSLSDDSYFRMTGSPEDPPESAWGVDPY